MTAKVAVVGERVDLGDGLTGVISAVTAEGDPDVGFDDGATDCYVAHELTWDERCQVWRWGR